MKILFCVDDFKGGAGNVVQLLSMELLHRNYQVVICCLGGNTPGRHALNGITVYRLPPASNKLIRYYHYAFDVRGVINKERPDCIISFLFGVSAFVNLAMLGKSIPLIVSERSDPQYLKPTGILKVLTEFSYQRAQFIVVLFDCFRNISGGKYYDKAIVIPNPVPIMDCLQHERNNPDEGIRFVTIANDTPPKGLDILVSAFSIVVKKFSNSQLRIYGSQKDDKLKKQILAYGLEDQISLMGYTLDISGPLSWADVYVMPSRHEGFPNSLCEAMSAGKCCIATICHEGIKELIEDGVNGLLADTENPKSIAEKMIYVIDNPEKINLIGKQAASISDKYNMNSILDMWESAIRKCCKTVK